VLRSAGDGERRVVGAGAARLGAGGSRDAAADHLRGDSHRFAHVAREIHVVHAVVLQVRRVGHHRERLPVHFPAHVHLPRHAIEDLLQRLVDGVEIHRALDSGVDVEVHARLASHREEDLAHGLVRDHDEGT
jgi:hypothetical protein